VGSERGIGNRRVVGLAVASDVGGEPGAGIRLRVDLDFDADDRRGLAVWRASSAPTRKPDCADEEAGQFPRRCKRQR
jgi:hypothetical protein